MVTSDFRPKVEIQPYHACAVHLAMIIETGHQGGRGYGADTTFHSAFLVVIISVAVSFSARNTSVYEKYIRVHLDKTRILIDMLAARS